MPLTITKRKRRTPQRTEEQKADLKAVIEDWRQETFIKKLGWSQILDNEVIMGDDTIKELVDKGASVETADSVLSIINWEPYDDDVLQDLASKIIKFNNGIDTKKRIKVSEAQRETSLDDRYPEGIQVQIEGVQAIFCGSGETSTSEESSSIPEGSVSSIQPVRKIQRTHPDQFKPTISSVQDQKSQAQAGSHHTTAAASIQKNVTKFQRPPTGNFKFDTFKISTPSSFQDQKSQVKVGRHDTTTTASIQQATRRSQRTTSGNIKFGQFKMTTPTSFQNQSTTSLPRDRDANE
ncbi:hypothetical protein BGZ65_008156 [Modicella reniformis]|uniref:Uncharacterized protein n=1 Tax=Modicella reniformis TaxID=1440133 RepID=A0A9P6M3C8_9FUNG|nr:hypothetical protein BGZ65_008156 [Modicella reniformis]